MKRYVILFFIAIIVLSCLDGDELRDYEAIITNDSGATFTVYFYSDESLIKEEVLNDSESTSCTYTSEFFENFNICNENKRIDLIRLVFDNGRGYVCDFLSTEPDQELCFGESKSIFKKSSFNYLENNRYQFTITEEDFSNAHDLPG